MRKQHGFTMIEMLAVLAIIGVLLTISLVAYGSARDKTRLSRVRSNIGEISLSLDDFSRDHQGSFPALVDYHNVDPPGYSTTPPPPADPVPNMPDVLKRRGNAISGGAPALIDSLAVLQDDYFKDELTPTSFFRVRKGEMSWNGNPSNYPGPMHPIDVLVLNGQFSAYPINPLAGPGVPMVNIAHFLYDYDVRTNDFQWVTMTLTDGQIRTGLTAALPGPEGLYQPIQQIWTEDTYPQGNFAYIPFNFTNSQATYCEGYWLISYGDLDTLKNSPYNKYSLGVDGVDIDPNYTMWPNLPFPYGDSDPSTPPAGVEIQIKRLMLGALSVQTTILEELFSE